MPDPGPADRIQARSDAAARDRYLRFLQKSLRAVHSTAIWLVVPVPRTPGAFSTVTVPDVLPLKTSAPSDKVSTDRLYLRATQRFTYGDHPMYAGDRKVFTEEYIYTLANDEDLADELYSWQWHPAAFPEPHVHVMRGQSGAAGLGKLHIPTGRVAFEQVLKFAILDHGVVPAMDRDQAIAVLDESLRRFQAFRTWA